MFSNNTNTNNTNTINDIYHQLAQIKSTPVNTFRTVFNDIADE